MLNQRAWSFKLRHYSLDHGTGTPALLVPSKTGACTQEQLNDAIFGFDENGNLEVIGSRTDFELLKEQMATIGSAPTSA